ncbi:hypothetical protein L6452_15740 [Arctium lappa]|uniref:Uncharacterized protein n=1 Tax=Arctium lappa TaxID=4217 RepID=A0ACB9CPI7_ARCLA|nr:hypothetical protein L6452_15740 [Arctium lappa]
MDKIDDSIILLQEDVSKDANHIPKYLSSHLVTKNDFLSFQACMLKNFENISKYVLNATKASQPQPAQNIPVHPSTTPTPASPLSSTLPTYQTYVHRVEFDNLNSRFDVMEDQISEVDKSIKVLVLAEHYKVQAENKRKFDDYDDHNHQKGEKRQRTKPVEPSCVVLDVGESAQDNQDVYRSGT